MGQKYKVAITGGIGSGKSTVCRIFSQLGVPIYDSDREAKRITVENPEVVKAMKEILGEDVYGAEGELNRDYVGRRVFEDKKILESVNNIIHPAVMQDFERWASQQKDADYVVMESAIIFDANLSNHFDSVITVSAPIKERVSRVAARDGVSVERVMQRVKSQIRDEDRELLADYTIKNEEGAQIMGQVLELHEIFTKRKIERRGV